MNLPSVVRFVDSKTRERFYKLETGDYFKKQLFRWLNSAMDKIEADAFCGIAIPKKLIPKEYIKKFKLDNLWKYNLPQGWRLLYSIDRDELCVVSFILEWLPHKDYERRFNY